MLMLFYFQNLKRHLYKKKLRFAFSNKKQFLPIFFIVYLSLKRYLNWLPGWSCPIRHATGLPCPTCFLTRSVSASLNGNLSEALEYHIFGPPIAFSLIYWSILAIRRRKIVPFKLNSLYVTFFFSMIFTYWAIRLILSLFFGIQSFPVSSQKLIINKISNGSQVKNFFLIRMSAAMFLPSLIFVNYQLKPDSQTGEKTTIVKPKKSLFTLVKH